MPFLGKSQKVGVRLMMCRSALKMAKKGVQMTKRVRSEELTKQLNEALQSEGIPGAVALVTTKEQVIYDAAFGWSNVGRSVKMRSGCLFRIASMTKAITSLCVMQLIEKSLIEIDDPVRTHMPDLPAFEVFTSFDENTGQFKKRPAARDVTIKHLLTHTAGLALWFNSPTLFNLGEGKKMRQSWRYPLHHDPGERWTYGDATALLGELIAHKTGQSIEAYMRQNIFDPLQMSDTGFSLNKAQTCNLVTLHHRDEQGFKEKPNPDEIVEKGFGDGGLITTASDYAKFMRVFLNKGRSDHGNPVLRPDLILEMGKNHIGDVELRRQISSDPVSAKDFPQGAGVDRWGLGFQIAAQKRPHMRPVGSLSWGGLFNTKFWIDPQNEIAAVLLMQYLPFDDEAHIRVLNAFETGIYQSLVC